MKHYIENSNINYLYSESGLTPSYPAGHAFQAHYLAHILTKRYPDKKDLLYSIAEKCDDCFTLKTMTKPFTKSIVSIDKKLITKIALNFSNGEFNICSGKGKMIKEIALEIGEFHKKKELIIFDDSNKSENSPKKIIGDPN